MAEKTYWSEPVKENFKWVIKKYDHEDKVIKVNAHDTEKAAWEDLKTINVYLNGELAYSGI